MARLDPHSVFDDAQPRLVRLDWRARLDFTARVIHAEARLTFDRAGGPIDLDARDLTVERVGDAAGARVAFALGAPQPFLGQRLRLHDAPAEVRITYRTSPAALALKWFNQSVYSQCQPIYARTIVPLPDSPASRFVYRAEVTAPTETTVLMAAPQVARHDTDAAGTSATTTFELVKPIPPYLFAVAAGDYTARELSPRSRVWAAPEYVDAAARRLRGVARVVAEAERLLGPYHWDRFDLLIAPVSFPYGGMENPGLVFLSPTLLDDEEELTSVVAHELAHAWTGNLVTAASAEHFWLNEAFTVWAERRILAAVVGEGAAAAHAARGGAELARALPAFAQLPERTRLRLSLDGVDPDEALSIVPYEKGYLMLSALEAAMGEGGFADFVRAYVAHFAGRSIATEDFLGFAEVRAPKFSFAEWLNQSGLPAGVVVTPPTASEPPPLDPAALEATLATGRIKLLRPIYARLAARPETRADAARLYRRFREGYHPIARQQLERLLREHGVAVEEVKPLGLGGRRT